MSAPDDATRAQHAAAQPDASTWLSANAGSGKTRVLTDRVARLLLGRVPPTNILCLTYTKAAAGEMQNRLFKRLGAWAMKPDAVLESELRALGVNGPLDLPMARTLFARAIETPGGLKIQTIHSFCGAILRQFPLEAGVSPKFREMDDHAQTLLMAEVLESLAQEDPGGHVSAMARYYTGETLLAFAESLVATPETGAAAALEDVLREYGLPAGLDAASMQRELALDPALLERVADVCAFGSDRDQKLAEKVRNLDPSGPVLELLPKLEGLFLTKSGNAPFTSKAGSIPTKETRGQLGADLDPLNALMDRVEALRAKRVGLLAAQRTSALRGFAQALIPAYEAAKAARGLLDFNDLIGKVRRLLSDAPAAEWVKYRLDGAIEHVLVDEAQDTSPAQWAVVEELTREFGSGSGTRADDRRTLFVVGDPKQSIYSFQGADAEAFAKMKTNFSAQLKPAGGMAERDLQHSFRSAPAILQAVDATFDGDAGAGLGGPSRHLAFFDPLPGRVDLWPLVEKPDGVEAGDWWAPVDQTAPDDPANLLAARVADHLDHLIHKAGETIPYLSNGRLRRRAMHEGDVLILVQRRNALFHALIRALKVRGLAVAGADRLKIAGEMAVRDLTALLAFLALPEDSLSLAAALRSPLLGWSEDDLFRLAHGRGERPLWATLRDRTEWPETLDILSDLRDRTDFDRPYELLERVLVRHGGRSRLVARLGPEAEDGIDELLTQALSYEAQQVPSLTGFLDWLGEAAAEVKRQAETGSDRIQVMTVHGAKGLERPVVILPDTVRGKPAHRNPLLVDRDVAAHWRPPASEATPHLSEVSATEKRRAAAENQRLLYVAMTRAANWLIVSGSGDPTRAEVNWHDTVRTGLEAVGAVTIDTPTGEGLRLETGNWAGGDLDIEEATAIPDPELPAWIDTPAPPAEDPMRTLTPSDLGGPKALPGELEGRDAAGMIGADARHHPDFDDPALRRGRQVHLLLEHLPGLPPSRHVETACALLSHGPDAASQTEAESLAREVGALLARPELAGIFGPDSLAEVPLTGTWPGRPGIRLHGAVDRLVLSSSRVLAVDFKTNRLVPDSAAEIPAGLLRQLGAYAAVLDQIYPERAVEVAILWTATGSLMAVPHDIVMKALEETPIS